MQQWIDKTVYKMQQWMQGRYGHDELNAAACILSLLLIICSFFPSLRFLFLPALALLLWSCFRCYSKNLGKRRAERDAFLHFTGKIASWFRLQRDKWRDRKDYRYFRCKECRAPLRVPKGKGPLRIRCPKCRAEIQGKT